MAVAATSEPHELRAPAGAIYLVWRAIAPLAKSRPSVGDRCIVLSQVITEWDGNLIDDDAANTP